MAAGYSGESTHPSTKRIQQTNAEVNEIVDIMRINVDKVIQRDEKLSDLDNRAETLQVGARQFESSATRMKRKFWWQNLKMWILLVVIALIIIIIIIVAAVTSKSS